MKKYGILWLLFGLLVYTGCADEDALRPLGVEEPFLTLPQGENEWDERIMGLYNEYGVSIFYKFSEQDVYWGWTSGAWSKTSLEKKSETVYYSYEREGDATTDNKVYFTLNEAKDSVIVWQGNSNTDETQGPVGPKEEGRYKIGVTAVLPSGYDPEIEVDSLKTTITVDYDLENNPFEMTFVQEYYDYLANSFSVECADSNYVMKQLDLLESMLLNNYSQAMLKLGMPPRILLGKQLEVATTSGPAPQSYFQSNNNFILSHGDFTIDTLSGNDLKKKKNGFNVWFLADGMADELYEDVLASTDFFSHTDYNGLTGNYANAYRGQSACVTQFGLCLYGFSLEDGSNIGMPTSRVTIEQKQRLDLRSFIAMAISFPRSYLEEDVKYVNTGVGLFNVPYNMNDPKGRLSQNTGQDKSGKIKAKYDIIVDYLTSIGVNVEELANAYWDEQTSYE